MATISFKVRTGTNNSSSIYLIFSYGRKNELRYSTGWKVINENNWNKSQQRVKAVVAEPKAKKINQNINTLDTFFSNKYEELLDSNIEVNNNVLRNELDIFFKKKKTKKNSASYRTLLECYKWYYEHFSINPMPSTKNPMSTGTIKSYKTSLGLLQKFNDKEYAINYTQITIEFYYDFLEFLRKKNYSNNYISKQIKNLKSIMNFAWEHKFHKNLDFKHKAFTKISEEVNHIYLNLEELKKINNLKLKGELDNARDLFILAANTGLRVSDFNRLSKENIKTYNERTYIEIKTKKTNSLVVIPINNAVKKILKKHKGHPPKHMDEQKINIALKTIGGKAKFKSMVTISRTVGGIKTITEKPKHKCITNHTARRSFCTNAYKSGMPAMDIMAISGHKTERAFYSYIKITDLERLEKISKHPFFN